MNCPICGKDMEKTKWNKRFCNYDCYRKYNALRKCKEVFRLSNDDRLLIAKLRVEGVI